MSRPDDLVLLPRPRHLEATGLEGAPATTPASTLHDPAMPAQGYRLTITPDEVRLDHADDLGRRYGSALLDQVRAQTAAGARLRSGRGPEIGRAHV